MIHYKITPSPLDHEWHILLTFTQDDDLPIEISLPNWVPGSYLIRDFSRHITSIHASCNGTSMPLEQIAKNRWHAAAVRGEWQIRYTVYAFDLSVRGSFLTTERGFFDGSCLFLKVEGTETLPHRLELTGIPSEWRIATTLPETGRFVFQAASYAELIDRPVEMGLIEFLDFEAAGIPHTIALSGIYPDFDRNRLVSDIKKICETELAVFSSPAPFQKYLFLLHVGDHIYGGLE
ncbi:TPA: M61 family peptidase, partial [Neisseria meningitidis]